LGRAGSEKKFKSDAFAAIHASAAALQRVGAIDQTTMRQFDETCLSVPTTLAPTQINPFLHATSIPANPPFKSGNPAVNNPAAWPLSYWR
jgi:hypothetical protein